MQEAEDGLDEEADEHHYSNYRMVVVKLRHVVSFMLISYSRIVRGLDLPSPCR
jgi:hypothetical protein